MKYVKTLIALLMVTVLLATSVFAVEIPIGSLQDQDGVLIEAEIDETTDITPRYVSWKLFSMTVNELSGLLTTYNSAGKNFTTADITNGNVRVYGTVTNDYAYQSPTDPVKIRVGVCWFNAARNEFVADEPLYFESGIRGDDYIPESDLDSSKTYYGFVNNYQGVGQVTGSLVFADYRP